MTPEQGKPRAILLSADPVRAMAAFALSHNLEVAARGTAAEDVSEIVDDEGIDLIVVDLEMPIPGALDVLREATREPLPVGAVALTLAPLKEEVVARATQAGAFACVTPRTVDEYGQEPFVRAAGLQPFLATDEIMEMLAAGAEPDAVTGSERASRLRSLVVGLIPLAGVFVALISLLWRRYLGQIGVRPVDLAVDPATRIGDVFLTLSILVGLVGPQFFIGSWLDLIQSSVDPRLSSWIGRHRKLCHLTLALVAFALAATLAYFGQVLFALVFGPLVAGLLLAKIFDLDDDLPAVLRIGRLRPSRAAAGAALVLFSFLAVLSYEVLFRGPSFDAGGETGWLAPEVLGFNAQPVEVTVVDGGAVKQMLYLGGNADLYVLVDPCDADRVDLVPVGSTSLTVIDRVSCR